MEKIETLRLELRNFIESDYDDLYELLSQRKDDQFEGYPGIDYENGRFHLSYRLNSDEFIAIVLKEENKVIGNIYLGNKNYSTKELGYIINKNYQRRGFASEAIYALIADAFAKGTHRIYAETDPRNNCSWELLESLGFEKEAHFKKNVFFKVDEFDNPIWQDTFVYSLLNEK